MVFNDAPRDLKALSTQHFLQRCLRGIIVLISQAFTSMTADSYKIAFVDICRSVVSILLTNTPTAHNISQSPVFLTYIKVDRSHPNCRQHSMHCCLLPQILSKTRSEILDTSKVSTPGRHATLHSPHSDSQQTLRRPSLQHSQKIPYHPPIHTTPVTSHMPS